MSKKMTCTPLENLKSKIEFKGGFVNAHSHLDRAYTIDTHSLEHTNDHLFEKWEYVDRIKKDSTQKDYFDRIKYAVKKQVAFGVSSCLTFIDVDNIVFHNALTAANDVKDLVEASYDFDLMIASQALKGICNIECRLLLEKALELNFIDIIGGLPRADKGKEEEHLDTLFYFARKYGKRVHVHVDQLNSPYEKETELLARKTMDYGLEGMVTAVHSISLAAHPVKYRKEVYKMSQDAGLSFVTCPSAWIDHKRNEMLTPTHSAVTPVEELLEHNLTVAIGSDNIHDVYKPYADGDMFFELRLLLESCKIYNEDVLVKIATENGRQIIGL